MDRIKVIIVEPYYMIREALAEIIEKKMRYIAITRRAESVDDCIEFLRDQEVDLIITELCGKEYAVRQLIGLIKEEKRKEKIILLSDTVESKFVEMILSPHGGRGGLRSYIWKGSELSELEKGVRAVISGQKYIDGAILQLLEEKERRRKEEQRVGTQEREQQESLQDIMQIQTLKENLEEDHREKYDNETPLSKRELEILKMLTSGKLNKEIAYELSISEKTVKNHISNIFKKIGVGDRTQAAVYAIKNSIVSL